MSSLKLNAKMSEYQRGVEASFETFLLQSQGKIDQHIEQAIVRIDSQVNQITVNVQATVVNQVLALVDDKIADALTKSCATTFRESLNSAKICADKLSVEAEYRLIAFVTEEVTKKTSVLVRRASEEMATQLDTIKGKMAHEQDADASISKNPRIKRMVQEMKDQVKASLSSVQAQLKANIEELVASQVDRRVLDLEEKIKDLSELIDSRAVRIEDRLRTVEKIQSDEASPKIKQEHYSADFPEIKVPQHLGAPPTATISQTSSIKPPSSDKNEHSNTSAARGAVDEAASLATFFRRLVLSKSKPRTQAPTQGFTVTTDAKSKAGNDVQCKKASKRKQKEEQRRAIEVQIQSDLAKEQKKMGGTSTKFQSELSPDLKSAFDAIKAQLEG